MDAQRPTSQGRSIMTAQPKTAADPQRVLLTRLGLDERATVEDVADTHDELVAFLMTAPKSLRSWARTQAAAADEAFALLTDPDAPDVAGALSAAAAHPTVQPDGPATPPARRAPSTKHQAAVAEAAMTATATDDSEQSFEEMLAEVTPGTHRESLSARSRQRQNGSAATAEAAAPRGTRSFPLRRLVVAGAIVIGVIGVAFGGYQLGAAPGTAANLPASPAPAASPALDEALVANLMTKIQADPNDTVSMMQLGNAFYEAADFGAAATWFGKILDVDKTDTRARLALGAAYFNLGDMASAETAWLAVLAQDAANVEAHYDLGFLYLNRDPADMDGVRREWGEVVRLAPDSDVAQTVKAHLDALTSPAPSSAPGAVPSGPPSAAPSGAPSAVPSAAPSGSSRP
jgi:cytochrome c-type biogenesis protein CcmH/NrfG